MPRIIVATTPQTGHVLPVLSLMPELKQQGYDITFITGSWARQMIEAKGIRHVALQGKADYDATDVNQTFPARRTLLPGPTLLDFDFRVLFIEPLVDQARTIQAVLDERSEPAVLITNHMFAGGWPFQLGMPGNQPLGVIALGITPLMLSTDTRAPFGPGLPPARTDADQQHYAHLRQALNQALQGSQHALNSALHTLGARPTAHSFLDATTLLPSLFLQMTVPGLEYDQAHLPASIRLIGTAPTPTQGYPAPAWWHEVEAGKRSGKPVIFVTQGTVARNLEALVYPTLDALAGTDALVIATAGKRSGCITPSASANTYCIDYLPYEQVLPLADVMVTNGGYGGVQQALRHGVPLVMAGTSEDKAEVAARVAWAGAGIDLKTDHPGVAQISSAVSRVLHNPGLKAAAMGLSAQYQALDPALALKQAVEGLFAH
jgi:UDP:flavonoid glycosyltransferase YjiC (YdhE family)